MAKLLNIYLYVNLSSCSQLYIRVQLSYEVQLVSPYLTKSLRQNKIRHFLPAANRKRKWPGCQILD